MADLVTVASFDHETEATLAQHLLEDAGIKSVILDPLTNVTTLALMSANEGVRLQVLKQDLERAKEILMEKFDRLGWVW